MHPSPPRTNCSQKARARVRRPCPRLKRRVRAKLAHRGAHCTIHACVDASDRPPFSFARSYQSRPNPISPPRDPVVTHTSSPAPPSRALSSGAGPCRPNSSPTHCIHVVCMKQRRYPFSCARRRPRKGKDCKGLRRIFLVFSKPVFVCRACQFVVLRDQEQGDSVCRACSIWD